MNKISFKEFEVEHICNKKLKNSYIKINHDGKIIVKTPKVSNLFVQELLNQKEVWIRKQLLKIQDNPIQRVNFEDEVLLFGEIVSIDKKEAEFLRLKLLKIKTSQKKNILQLYDSFYKYHAQAYLPTRINYFANMMSLQYNSLKFRKMKSRWGSCNSEKVITLNSELIKIKKELIDYVVVHELAHLVHMNHSRAFHQLVEEYLPQAKILRKELKSIHLI